MVSSQDVTLSEIGGIGGRTVLFKCTPEGKVVNGHSTVLVNFKCFHGDLSSTEQLRVL